MLWLHFVLGALMVVPLIHQVSGHNLHLRLARLAGSRRPVPQTEHERRHEARSAPLRLVANTAWIIYILSLILLAIRARRGL